LPSQNNKHHTTTIVEMKSNQEDPKRPATNIMDEEVEDGNCVLHQRNKPDSLKLGLPPQQRSQRVMRQSSRLLSSILKKKITVNNSLGDSKQPLQKEQLSDHGDNTVAGPDNEPSTLQLRRSQSCLTKTSSMRSSIASGDSVLESDGDDFDIKMKNPSKAFMTMLQNFGDPPSTHELNKIVAICAKEYIDERLSSEYRGKWDNIPQFSMNDLILGQFLGKGSFSDVVEVFTTVITNTPTLDSLASDKDYDAKFEMRKSSLDDSNEDSSHATEGEGGNLNHRDDLDDEIDAMFGSNLDDEIDAMFGYTSPKASPQANHEVDAEHPNQDDAEAKLIARPCEKTQEHQITLAMKRLRKQFPVNAEHFIGGVEDLVHESAILASLNHPNIVKIHGRTRTPFRLSDGYFILLDRLSDTLDDRILRWKKVNAARSSPSLSQIKTACSIADAMTYLHDKNVLFRDLKPTNVGFDSRGVLKLFDFGFAVCMSAPQSSSTHVEKSDDGMSPRLLYDKCGTLRYMAPEVGLETGHSFPADVHSFGILLWQICALKKPFHDVKSTDQFHEVVFLNGTRPKLSKRWPQVLTDIMTNCWSISALDRPDMRHVKTVLSKIALDASTQQNHEKVNLLNRSIIAARRFTG
jgi:serine/threonine protein kinase